MDRSHKTLPYTLKTDYARGEGKKLGSRLALIVAFVLITGSAADAESWPLSALEYPPFSCENCPGHGANAQAFTEALTKQKITVQFTWLPWSRAIMEARKKISYGYFPAWPEDCQEGFTFSEPISHSPLGLVERRNHPLLFNKLSDLKKYTLGIVQDYGNTVEFNKLVKQGVLKPEIVTTDTLNVRKVAMGRIDGALIDENVLKHILTFENPELASSVQFNKKILELKPLGICFRNDLATELNAKLKTALKSHQSQKQVDLYLKNYFKKSDLTQRTSAH